MKIKISGLDDSASPYPPLVATLAGFETDNLVRLYLFEDGDNGDPYTSALDSAGVQDGTPLTGAATPTKTASGIQLASLGNGVMYHTGLPAAGAFTLVEAFKLAVPYANGSSGNGVMTWASNLQVGGGSASLGSSSTTGAGVGGYTATKTPTTDTAFYMDGLYTNGSPAFQQVTMNPGDEHGWVCRAISFDPATDTFQQYLHGAAAPATYVDATVGTSRDALAGYHVFGLGRFGSQMAQGEIGLAAFYSNAKDLTDLQALVSTAMARLALRSVVPQ